MHVFVDVCTVVHVHVNKCVHVHAYVNSMKSRDWILFMNHIPYSNPVYQQCFATTNHKCCVCCLYVHRLM